MHAGGKSTLASVSKWNSGKVNSMCNVNSGQWSCLNLENLVSIRKATLPIVDALGKFVSGAKVQAVVPSVSQRRRVYRELQENKNRLETGGKAVVNKV